MSFAYLVSVDSLLVELRKKRHDNSPTTTSPHRDPSIPWAGSGLPRLDSHIGLGDQKVPRNQREFPWRVAKAQAVQVTR